MCVLLFQQLKKVYLCQKSANISYTDYKQGRKAYISTSLNVVSNAKVFWESFKRVATRFLSLVIGTCSYISCKILNNQIWVTKRPTKVKWIPGLTLLSLSLGGSWGSVAEGLLRGGEGALGVGEVSALDLGREVSSLGFSLTVSFFSADVLESALLGACSDGATCATPSPDFEIIAILVPGSTVSPSLATNYRKKKRAKYKFKFPIHTKKEYLVYSSFKSLHVASHLITFWRMPASGLATSIVTYLHHK